MQHLDRNGLISDYQVGFTEIRRLEENLFIVRYCIEETYMLERELVVIAIDVEKTFDSVGRLALVIALKFYKCEQRLIYVIVDLYIGDRTEV